MAYKIQVNPIIDEQFIFRDGKRKLKIRMHSYVDDIILRYEKAQKELGVPLKELPLRSGILVAGIIRGRRTLIPTGDDSIQAGDRVVVLAAGAILGDLADILR